VQVSEGTKREKDELTVKHERGDAKDEGTAGAKNEPLGVEGVRQSGVEFRFAVWLTGIRGADRRTPKKAAEERLTFRIFVKDKCRFFVAALLRMTV
jgi:hypothetical protein